MEATEQAVSFYLLYNRYQLLKVHPNLSFRELAIEIRPMVALCAKTLHLELTDNDKLEVDLKSMIENINLN
ncbi:MAG: hypothetical protein JXB19_00305 [Bacteroidales bacterium]|nr:hypothetical protein [Bacteroidales bacterium]